MQTFKRCNFVLLHMINCYETELALLQKHWDILTDDQRSEVLDDLYDSGCIDTDILDDLSMKYEVPHVADFNRPNIGLCLDVIEKMTPTELHALETHMCCTVDELKVRMNDGNVLFFLLQNYLVSHFTLHLPPLEVFVIPDYYEVPFKIRKQSRAHLKQHRNSTRPHSA